MIDMSQTEGNHIESGILHEFDSPTLTKSRVTPRKGKGNPFHPT